jgi:hypothetical protein
MSDPVKKIIQIFKLKIIFKFIYDYGIFIRFEIIKKYNLQILNNLGNSTSEIGIGKLALEYRIAIGWKSKNN